MRFLSSFFVLTALVGGATAETLRKRELNNGVGGGNGKFRPPPEGAEVVENSYIIVLSDDAPPGKAVALAALTGGTVKYTYSVINAVAIETDRPLQAIEAVLGSDGDVEFFEADQVAYATSVASWGLDRIDQPTSALDGAFNPRLTGEGVTAYVVDTGIDPNHIDLPNVLCGVNCLGGSCTTSGCGDDDNFHGTHCAGTLASPTYGVAKKATLVPVKVLNSNGNGSYASVIAGIDWVFLHFTGPSVASVSLEGGAADSLNNAVNNLAGAGVPVAVAAGNGNTDANTISPASAADAITVGSTGTGDVRSGFSNYGTAVDIFAPGEAILSTYPNNAYNSLWGTSMATPHVAGAVALLMGAGSGLSGPAATAAVLNMAISAVTTNAAQTTDLLLQVEYDSACPLDNCVTCVGGDPGTCAECESRFFYDASGGCTACPSLCFDCSSDTSCSSCNPGIDLIANTCVDCPDFCTDCQADGNCADCDFGYYVDTESGNCASCASLSGCLDCAVYFACDVCEPQLELVNGFCVNCPDNCQTCAGENNCDLCQPGFYGSTCVACTGIPGCTADCNMDGTCNTCQDGFYVDLAGSCQTCPAGCDTCTASDTCQTCQAGYFLNGAQCDPCTDITGCTSDCNADGTCNICQSGFYLDMMGVCQACSTGCSTCSSTSCDVCDPGYELIGGACVQCPANCDSCDAQGSCTDCATGYYVDAAGQCTSCPPILGCLDCSDSNTCTSCQAGLDLIGGSCVDCPGNCQTCLGDNDCGQCDTGFYGPTCAPCTDIAGCTADCNMDGSCNTCQGGFELFGGVCVQCPANCDACDSQGRCTDCSTGYYVDGGSCTSCTAINGCLACSNDGTCTSCDSGFSLVGGVCVNCAASCASCDASGCTSCISGFYLSGNQCSSCQNYDTRCTQCTETTCTNCGSNYQWDAAEAECIENGCAGRGGRCRGDSDCCYSDSFCVKPRKGPRVCS